MRGRLATVRAERPTPRVLTPWPKRIKFGNADFRELKKRSGPKVHSREGDVTKPLLT